MAHIYSQTAISKSVPEPMQWLPAQGPKITDMILDLVTCTQRFLQILSFDDLPCRWWDVKSLHNFTMWNIILKLFHNLMMDFFLQTSAHLCFWETLEKNYFYTQSYYRPAANCKSFFKMQVTYSSMWKVQLCSNEKKKKILMHTSEQWFLRLIALNWFVFCSPEILYFERVCKVFESQCCSQTMFSLQTSAGGNVLNRVRKHVKMTEKLS